MLRALGLGDLLASVAALRALRRAFPGHHIQLAASLVLAGLAQRSGAVDEVVDTAALSPLPDAARGATLAVNLHGRGPESSRLLAATGPKRAWAFAHPEVPWTVTGPAWRDDEHEGDRWCRLVAGLGASPDPTDLLLPVTGTALAPAPVVVHPGAASGARRWPPQRWSTVVRVLTERSFPVVLTGSAAERALCEEVAAGANNREDGSLCTVLAGTTDLVALLDLVGHARLVVCGDTGVAHMATATATPSVVLFGPTDPARWGPRTSGPHRALWAGQVGDPHAAQPGPGLLAITVAQVLTEVEAALVPMATLARVAGPRAPARAGSEGAPEVQHPFGHRPPAAPEVAPLT